MKIAIIIFCGIMLQILAFSFLADANQRMIHMKFHRLGVPKRPLTQQEKDYWAVQCIPYLRSLRSFMQKAVLCTLIVNTALVCIVAYFWG